MTAADERPEHDPIEAQAIDPPRRTPMGAA